MSRCLLFLLLPLLLAACSTPAKRLEPAVVAQIEPGMSRRADVEKLLGRPRSLETAATGRTLAVYGFGQGQAPEKFEWGVTDVRLRFLSLLYDPQFVVEKKLLSENRTKYKVGFFSPDRLGQPIRREDIIEVIKPGITREEVIEKFGPPSIEVLTLDGRVALGWVAAKQRFSLVRPVEVQEVTVFCDDHGIVLDYTVSGTLEPKPPKPAK